MDQFSNINQRGDDSIHNSGGSASHGPYPHSHSSSPASTNGMNQKEKRAAKSSGSSTLSELTSSDDDVSIFGNDSINAGSVDGNNGVVTLGNGLFSYSKNLNSEENMAGGSRATNGSGHASNLEDWNSGVSRHHQQNGSGPEFNQWNNGSLTQPFGEGPVRNGRNPPTTIPRLHSASGSGSNPRRLNGINGSSASRADGSRGNGHANSHANTMRDGDGDEDMFESLIQEDSFDPPSLRNSVSPQQSLKHLPQSGLSISTAPDRIPPSYYPSRSGMKSSQGQVSAGAEGESGSPPLSADPSLLSSRRNSASEKTGDQSMEGGILSAPTPSIAGTSSYASGDDAPTPFSETMSNHGGQSSRQSSVVSKTRDITLQSKTPNAASTSKTTGLNPKGEIPFSSKQKDVVSPSISDLNQEGSPRLQVHVHGLPRKGAKSRVETQVKMRLELVREKVESQGTSSSSSAAIDDKEWERIGSFTHLKLPPLSGTKRSQKKYKFENIDPIKTLFVDVVVVKATPPHEKVTICESCRQREARKAQRGSGGKKGGKDEELSTDEDDFKFFGIDKNSSNSRELLREKKAEAEIQRSVVFNCGDYLEFQDGNVILPARITCYCRHHQEKLGFCIIFTMRDWQSNVVATGSTPPIMITDDHKATSKTQKGKAEAEEGLAAVVTSSRAVTSNSGGNGKNSRGKSAGSKTSVSTLAKGGKASERGIGRTTYNSSITREDLLSQDASPDSLSTPSDPSLQAATPASAASKKKDRAKPYDKSSSSTSKSRHRSESGTLSLASSPTRDPRSGNVTRSVTPANSFSPASASASPHHLPLPPPQSQLSPDPSIEQNEDWTSFAAAAGFMSRSASDSGRSMTTATAFSPMSNSSMTAAEPQSVNTSPVQAQASQIPTSTEHDQLNLPLNVSSLQQDDNGSQIPSHMQGSLSSTNLQTNLQSTPAFDLERFLRDAQDGVPVNSSGLQEFIALNGGGRSGGNQDGNEMDHEMDVDIVHPSHQHQLQQPQPSDSSYQQSFTRHQNAFQSSDPSDPVLQLSQSQPHSNPISYQSPPPSSSIPSIPAPRIEKLIPGEGPTSGGIEVTVLGSGFLPGLRCVFGDVQAPDTKVWAPNTLVCVLPPSPSPGPVVVSLKRVMESGELRDFDYGHVGSNDSSNNQPLRFFSYVDKTDRALMELALQVVGLQMTGQMQSARDVAMRVVGSGGAGSNGPSPNHSRGGSSSTPSGGQSRLIGDAAATASGADEISGLFAAGRGSSQSFQTSLLGFLSLLDVDLSNERTLSNGAPRLDALRLANSQGHTLLHLAVILGLHKLVEALLARKHAAPVNARDNNGYTALHFAALHGRLTIARTLLSRKARDDLVNVEGKIPLELAREKEQVDVELLLTENASLNARIKMRMESPALSESESVSADEVGSDGESNRGSSDEEEDIDEDNISTCASQLETSSDDGSSAEEDESEDLDEEILSREVDLNIDPSHPIVEKGNQTPQPLATPQDQRKDPFSSKSEEEKKSQESSDKQKEKGSESTGSSPGNETNLAFKDWLIQAGDSVRAGHGLEWAASNLPSGRRALQLIPRPNMALNMHMPAVPVFHLALPTTPRFGNLPWNSNPSSTATTPSASSTKGKGKELSQEHPADTPDEQITASSHSATGGAEAWATDEARKVINMCKAIVEESALWLNPLYQPLDASPPPTYESALASTSKEGSSQSSRLEEEEAVNEVDSGQGGLQLESGEEVSEIAEGSSSSRIRPSVTSRSTWSGKSSEPMDDGAFKVDPQEKGIHAVPRRMARPSSALSAPSSSSSLSAPALSSSSSSVLVTPASASASTANIVNNSNRRRSRPHAQPQSRRGLRDDLMLIFFWFPALLVVILLLFFSSNSSIFSLDELLSFIPGPIASATRAVRSHAAAETSAL